MAPLCEWPETPTQTRTLLISIFLVDYKIGWGIPQPAASTSESALAATSPSQRYNGAPASSRRQ